MESAKDLLSEFNANIPKVSIEEQQQINVDSFNARDGDLKGFDCPICKNKGKILKLVYRENYRYPLDYMYDCECMVKRKIIKRAETSGLGEYIHKRMNDYEATEDWQKDIKQKAENYLKDKSNKWFAMLGTSGCGKTLICSIISNYLLATRTVLYITWTDFISKAKRDMMGDNTQEVTKYLNDVKTVDVLFIDELLKKYNETDLKYIIEIINYRYTNDLKTIITSERTINELLDIDEATFSRVIEKADGYITNIKKDRSKNYRLRNIGV